MTATRPADLVLSTTSSSFDSLLSLYHRLVGTNPNASITGRLTVPSKATIEVRGSERSTLARLAIFVCRDSCGLSGGWHPKCCRLIGTTLNWTPPKRSKRGTDLSAMRRSRAPHRFRKEPMSIGKRQIFKVGMRERAPRNSTIWSMRLGGVEDLAVWRRFLTSRGKVQN